MIRIWSTPGDRRPSETTFADRSGGGSGGATTSRPTASGTSSFRSTTAPVTASGLRSLTMETISTSRSLSVAAPTVPSSGVTEALTTILANGVFMWTINYLNRITSGMPCNFSVCFWSYQRHPLFCQQRTFFHFLCSEQFHICPCISNHFEEAFPAHVCTPWIY